MRINQRWFVFVILILCLAAIPVSLLGSGPKTHQETEDTSSDTDSLSDLLAEDHISVIRLTGLIASDEDGSLWSNTNSAGAVLKQLRKAVKNNHVKAVLLRVNSPGGTVSTSQEIAEEIKNLKDNKKPVVISMGDLAASGGYYVACNADKIVADPGTITGSIGVIISSMNLKGLGDKFGVQPQVIKSGQFKDIGSPYRAMTPEDKAILQNLVMDAYSQFTEAVAAGRNMPIETIKKLADGRIYSGRQALQVGLVDKLGSYSDALDMIQDLCKERYNRKEKLPVKEASPKNFVSTLLESSIGPINFQAIHSANSPLNSLAFDAALPDLLRAKYHNQPLWLMQ